MTPLLIQMSGAPGTGKSTLARLIAPPLGAAVLDHDLIKSALVEQLPAPAMAGPPAGGRPDQAAGRASYELARRLAASLLGTGLSVILDSPCFHPGQLGAGQRIAASHGAAYRYVECATSIGLIAARLRTRAAYPCRCTA